MPGPKLGQLGRSTTCEIEDIEEEDERLVLLKGVSKGEVVSAGGRQLEVRRLISNRQH